MFLSGLDPAKCTAVAAAEEVFPLPPFPPKSIRCKFSASREVKDPSGIFTSPSYSSSSPSSCLTATTFSSSSILKL